MPDNNLELRLAIFGLGFVSAFRAVRRAVQAVTDAADEQQRTLASVARRIEGLGDATELSTPSLARMASELQRITTFGDEQILGLQSVLLTFRELQGLDEAAFRRVTETVLDMAAAMGTDAPSAARQLALAIEHPESGLRQLRDSGATFTEQQRETIESLVETGRRAEALGAILDVLEGQAGGSARALRDTLPGALDALDNAIDDLFVLPAESTRKLQGAIEELVGTLEDPATKDAAASLGRLLADMATGAIEQFRILSAEITALLDPEDSDLRLRALATRRMHLADMDPNSAGAAGMTVADMVADMDRRIRELLESRLGISRKGSAVILDLTAEVQPLSRATLDALRESGGDFGWLLPRVRPGPADLPRLHSGAADGGGDGAGSGARLPRRRPETPPLIERAMALTREAEAVGRSAEEHTILNELRRAGVEATIGQYEHIDAYIARLSDEERELALSARHLFRRTEAAALSARADREAAAALEERARAEEDAARRAIERGREIAEAAERARREALGPLGRGLEDYARDALDAADEIQLATEQAFAGMEGALVDFVRTGELEFRRLADFVIAELARIAVQRAITGPLSAALGGLLGLGGGSFRGVSEVGGHLFFHSGGVAGAPGGSVRHGVDPRTFAGAPRFPHGGIAGDEIPAILRRGEGVFTPEQMRALGGLPNIEVRLINEGGTPQEATDDGVRWDGEKFIVTVLLRDARGNGPVTQAFRHAVSRRP